MTQLNYKKNSTDILQNLYSLYLKFRFLFFVMITEFVGFYVGTHGCAPLQKPNFKGLKSITILTTSR
jgi:hypothetical protein